MQRLLSRHRFADTVRALRFLVIRLASRPETASLAEDTQARTAMRDDEEKYQQALQARVAAAAEIEYLMRRSWTCPESCWP